MSQVCHWKVLNRAASSASSGSSSGATALQMGSTFTIRAPGSTARMASIPAIAARASCSFSSSPWPRSKGANHPTSAPAQA
jgi:hypothetical protein